MRFLRKQGPAQDGGFWAWWSQARPRIEHAIEQGSFDRRLVDEISRSVKAIDPRLAWEFSKGRQARHAFTVTPEGNAMSRPAALTWLASAPEADTTWEFHASRQPSQDPGSFEVAGHRFDVDAVRAIASWDDQRLRADVRLWHPAWPEVPDIVRQQVAFLFLDELLGEDDVERWIGRIDLLDAPTAGLARDELRGFIRARAVDGNGDTWVVGEREDHRGQVEVVIANAALKRIDLPFADQHVGISIALDGMPKDALAEELNAAEDRLVALLGPDGALAGRTTSAFGRVMHFVAEDPDRVRQAIDTWAQELPPWRIAVNLEHDPTWEFQRSLGVR
jgi:hypothetical protein